jgi:hypothetical protein
VQKVNLNLIIYSFLFLLESDIDFFRYCKLLLRMLSISPVFFFKKKKVEDFFSFETFPYLYIMLRAIYQAIIDGIVLHPTQKS